MSDNATQLTAINVCKTALDTAAKPYFLYFMTLDVDNKIVAVSYKKDDTAVTELNQLSQYNEQGVAATITGHIDDALQPIYSEQAPAFATSSSSSEPIGTGVSINAIDGGSRSRKHRRRHKQNKNKNTKRRNRK
jgi:hypothetical protein